MVNYAALTGTIGRGGIPAIPGAENVMSEMSRRLRERRARTDGNPAVGLRSIRIIH